MITRQQLIDKYLAFFKSKDHKIIPSASLIPANDPTVLFTTAGMHPLVPYLLGAKHPSGKRLADVQKCVRTGDIEEVGDTTHHTFFEMLGNWSLGDYWKQESIEWSFEFLTKVLKLPKDKLAVTCFEGDKNAPKDTESEKIWLSMGMPKERIAFLPKEDNWWGPAGQTGPCGPDTEIFYWTASTPAPKTYDPKNKSWVEIWNNVFMEYEKTKDGKYIKAKQHNVDTGMGLERTLTALNSLKDNYETSSFTPLIEVLEEMSGKTYQDNEKEMRVVADHLRAAIMIIGDGIIPSNVEQGYVLRRLIRRAIVYSRKLGIDQDKPLSKTIAETVITTYPDYPELKEKRAFIEKTLADEENKFEKTLTAGMREFARLATKNISGTDAFLLFQSYGFPLEMTVEFANEKKIKVDVVGFEEAYRKHQELSKTTSAGAFKSGLADNSEQTTRLHTATHMLNEALRHVLGNDVKQRGSNITPERLRFDFNFPRKLTDQEIKKIEHLVNEKIKAHLDVVRDEVSFNEAIKSGAQAEFGHKYL
jgi:alanyl-tRNA synthetase